MLSFLKAGLPVAKGVLGFLGERSKAKRQNSMEMQKFVRLRQAAEAGGFHPLEALRSGQSVGATAGPRLFSSLAQSNSFDALENEITGEGAKQRNRQSVEDEIRERELENLKIVNQQMTTPTIETNRPPRLPPLGAHSGALDDIERGREIVTGSRDLDNPDAFVDPSRGDFAMAEERVGDNEIINTPMIAEQLWNDLSYRTSVNWAAKRLDMTPQELHQKIVDNPQLRNELPGIVARTTIEAQDLWNYLKENFEWPKLNNNEPRSYRLQPQANHSLFER